MFKRNKDSKSNTGINSFVALTIFAPFATFLSLSFLDTHIKRAILSMILRTAKSHSIRFIRITYIGLVC